MTSSLHTLLRHAEGERDAVLADMARAEHQLQQARLQTQQLLAYRDDYDARAPTAGGRSATITSLRAHQDFMQRLQQALDQAHVQEDTALARTQQLHRALLPLELRVASVRKLLERRADATRKTSAHRDQRQTDDAALQRHGRAHANALPTTLS